MKNKEYLEKNKIYNGKIFTTIFENNETALRKQIDDAYVALDAISETIKMYRYCVKNNRNISTVSGASQYGYRVHDSVVEFCCRDEFRVMKTLKIEVNKTLTEDELEQEQCKKWALLPVLDKYSTVKQCIETRIVELMKAIDFLNAEYVG